MTKVLIWLGLFGATAVTDWLSARWVDAATPKQRAALSAVHEAVGFLAGFTVFAVYRDLWMAVPCVLGAWVGSYFAGVAQPPDAVDADLVVACESCGRPFIAFTAAQTQCAHCEGKAKA